VIVIAGMLFVTALIRAEPPLSGTIFIDPDIIRPSDPTTFSGVTYAGQGDRLMYDRRTSSYNTNTAYLFNATFTDGFVVEIQVNPEFGSEAAALTEAEIYGPVIGQLPKALRVDLETVWIHKGVQPFGGGNNNLLIHTGQAELYVASGILEETLVHEAAHTSLDAYLATSAGWLNAQQADPDFVSTYARDNPTREDIAESFLPYLAAASHNVKDVAALLLETGMRPEEVLRSRIEHVHLESGYLFNPYGKTKAARRKIPLTSTALAILKHRLGAADGSPYLFPHRNDSERSITGVDKGHRAAIRDSGVRKFRLYDCRHTWATRAAEAGMDMVTLAALLGHSKLNMVMRYVHPQEKHQAEAMRRLEVFNAAKEITEVEAQERASAEVVPTFSTTVAKTEVARNEVTPAVS
jgi:hypothetical protein